MVWSVITDCSIRIANFFSTQFVVLFSGSNTILSIAPDGRVLATDTNGTGTVCANSWDAADATVLCRHLGLGSMGTPMYLSRDYMYSRKSYGIHCMGHETNMFDCHSDSTDMTGGMCQQMEDAGVQCHFGSTNHTTYGNNTGKKSVIIILQRLGVCHG